MLKAQRGLQALAVCLGILFPSALGALPPARRASATGSSIVVLRRAGFQQYEAAAAEFRTHIRAPVRLITIDEHDKDATLDSLHEDRPRLILALGRSAFDLAQASGLRPLVHAFVFTRALPSRSGIQMFVPPRETLDSLATLIPAARTVAILAGPATAWLAREAEQAATKRGLAATLLRANSAAEALDVLRRGAPEADALWLLPDSDLLTPQVVQYAIALQLRRHLPLVGATRRHVERGALLALDYAPHEIGRRAASMAHRLLRRRGGRRTSHRRRKGTATAHYGTGSPRVSVSQATARKLGLTVELLRRRTEVVR